MLSKHQYFDGKKFTRDERTGYYLCSTKSADGQRKRMHVYVWEYYNGKTPEGYHVHHIDGDKSNNTIENLKLISRHKHLSFHGKKQAVEKHDFFARNLIENAQPKAIKWHKSQEGREWHKNHYEKMKNKFHEKKDYICQNCGKEFISTNVGSKFCSNKCKSAFRRKSGVDDENRRCSYCGKVFVCNKYSEKHFCSNTCAACARRKKNRIS